MVDGDDLPIFSHTRVLGVDIGVRQRDGDAIDKIQRVGVDTRTICPRAHFRGYVARNGLHA